MITCRGECNKMDADHLVGKHRGRVGQLWQRCLGCNGEVLRAYRRPQDRFVTCIGINRLNRRIKRCRAREVKPA